MIVSLLDIPKSLNSPRNCLILGCLPVRSKDRMANQSHQWCFCQGVKIPTRSTRELSLCGVMNHEQKNMKSENDG